MCIEIPLPRHFSHAKTHPGTTYMKHVAKHKKIPVSLTTQKERFCNKVLSHVLNTS